MGILGADQEAPIRAALEVALPDRCTIKRVTQTQNTTTGGWSESESTFASDIPCRVDRRELSPRERAIGEREAAVAAYTVSLSTVASRWPAGTVDVQATDRLVITGDGAGTYEVAGTGGPVSDEFLREVPCNRVS